MRLEPRIPTRMGDGSLVEMTRSEIKADLEDGTQHAAKRAKVDPLTQDELDHLLDIYASSARFTAVDIGDEVVMSNDGTGTKHIGNRVQDLQSYEQVLGIDMVELWQIDYSYKAIKTNVAHEGQTMKIAQALLTNPVQYGAMPDLGRYSKPDGPIPNWSELLPLMQDRRGPRGAGRGLRDAGRRHQLRRRPHGRGRHRRHRHGHDRRGRRRRLPRRPHRLPHAARAVPVAGHRDRHGERVRARHARPARVRRRAPGRHVAQGPAAHGAGGRRLASTGPAVNINTGKSTAWNIARAITFIKPAMEIAEIPVHVNVGMGVGGVPTCVYPPADATSRASKAFVEILKIDGY